MKLCLLALWGYLVSFVLGFGQYGAYERALYWYAYELDAAVNGEPKYIAPRCTRGKPEKKCSFQQFLDFIDNSENTTPINRDVSGMTVDELAQKLQENEYTGKYITANIITGLSNGAGQIPTLFTRVSEALIKLQNRAADTDNTTVEKIHHAMKAVRYLRGVEYSQGLVQWLKDTHDIDAVLEEKKFPGSDPKRKDNFIDFEATRKKYKDKKVGKLMREYNTEHRKGKIHYGQVVALGEGLKMLLECSIE